MSKNFNYNSRHKHRKKLYTYNHIAKIGALRCSYFDIFYFPMQNLPKILLSTSPLLISPVMLPR